MTPEEVIEIYKTLIPDEKQCLIWPTVRLDGYPALHVNGKIVRLNRFFLSKKLGRKIKPGYNALHRCDNPACVSEDHLWEGTVLDNNRDCVSKGRNTKGELHGSSKLTTLDVGWIRYLSDQNIPREHLARAYGVTAATIRKIIRRQIWDHV